MAAEPDRVAGLLAKARRFTCALNLPPALSAVVPILRRQADRALAAATALGAQEFLAIAISPSTVPPGTARLRVAFAACHPYAEIDRLRFAPPRRSQGP